MSKTAYAQEWEINWNNLSLKGDMGYIIECAAAFTALVKALEQISALKSDPEAEANKAALIAQAVLAKTKGIS